jgi:dinuclear metal center YbgI/SA1388 family protein
LSGAKTITLKSLVDFLDQVAPPSLAESWDNVGLLVGDLKQDVMGVMLCIDYTQAVATEASSLDCNAIVAYHPPIFSPLKRVLAGHTVFTAIRSGTAIYSPHTALDVADGGTNDVLADALDLIDRRPLKKSSPAGSSYKLVTFVPVNAVGKVSEAIFNAGAGQIGKYASCSFQAKGTGTFFGQEGTKPAVGQSGRLEEVDEIRLETVVPIGKVDAVIAALRSAHPYEEPAFDLNVLAAAPTSLGLGRIGRFAAPIARGALFDRIKHALSVDHLLIAGPTDGEASTAAVCAGSCGGELLDRAIAQKVDIYLTGEMRHHDALKAATAGLTVVCTLHSHSERLTLKRLAEKLAAAFASLPTHLSQQDRDPFSVR